VNMSPNLPSEAAYAIQNIESPGFLIHFIASNLQIDVQNKQELLETVPLIERAELVLKYLEQENQDLSISEDSRSEVKTHADHQQREYLLRRHRDKIQDELAETEGGASQAAELRQRLDKRRDALPENVIETLEKELDKLSRTNP